MTIGTASRSIITVAELKETPELISWNLDRGQNNTATGTLRVRRSHCLQTKDYTISMHLGTKMMQSPGYTGSVNHCVSQVTITTLHMMYIYTYIIFIII
jgi:hypothetical protein